MEGGNVPEMLTVRVKRLIWGLNLALLAVAAVMAVRLFMEDPDLDSTPQASPPEAQVPSPSPDAQPTDPEAPGSVGRQDLFGSRAEKPPPEPEKDPEPSEPEPPPLRLRLVGTISGSAEMARAVIEDLEARSQNMYRIGDIVQGARIAEIERNSIVLEVEGRETVLELHLATGDDAPTPRPVARRGASSRPSAPEVDERAFQELSSGQYEVEEEAFLTSGGLSALLNAVELQPHVVEGETQGLVVANLEDGSLAQLAGIRSGDVIQRVNGQSLRSLPQAFQVMRKARVLDQLEMDILREGEERNMSFRMR